MKTIVAAKKRKIIDLDQSTFKSLSVMAANKGTNLKALIEDQLKEIVECYEDAQLYEYLVKTRLEGKMILEGREEDDFKDFLGI